MSSSCAALTNSNRQFVCARNHQSHTHTYQLRFTMTSNGRTIHNSAARHTFVRETQTHIVQRRLFLFSVIVKCAYHLAPFICILFKYLNFMAFLLLLQSLYTHKFLVGAICCIRFIALNEWTKWISYASAVRIQLNSTLFYWLILNVVDNFVLINFIRNMNRKWFHLMCMKLKRFSATIESR